MMLGTCFLRSLALAIVAFAGTTALAFAQDPGTVTAPTDVTVSAPAAISTAPAAPPAPAPAVAPSPAVVAPVPAVVAPVVAPGIAPAPAAAAVPAAAPAPTGDGQHWTGYGFNVTAPSTMWPMLELLHKYPFDWELYSAQQRPTPLVWSKLPAGTYGQYAPKDNIVRVSLVLQNESPELGAAFLAHELTHLTDDLNGKLGDVTGDLCYAAETRAFVNEANFWQMVFGPQGKTTSDPIEMQENTKMFAFVGNGNFADLVLRTTPSYVKQCGK